MSTMSTTTAPRTVTTASGLLACYEPAPVGLLAPGDAISIHANADYDRVRRVDHYHDGMRLTVDGQQGSIVDVWYANPLQVEQCRFEPSCSIACAAIRAATCGANDAAHNRTPRFAPPLFTRDSRSRWLAMFAGYLFGYYATSSLAAAPAQWRDIIQTARLTHMAITRQGQQRTVGSLLDLSVAASVRRLP